MNELFEVENYTITNLLKDIYKGGKYQSDSTNRKIEWLKKEIKCNQSIILKLLQNLECEWYYRFYMKIKLIQRKFLYL